MKMAAPSLRDPWWQEKLALEMTSSLTAFRYLVSIRDKQVQLDTANATLLEEYRAEPSTPPSLVCAMQGCDRRAELGARVLCDEGLFIVPTCTPCVDPRPASPVMTIKGTVYKVRVTTP